MGSGLKKVLIAVFGVIAFAVHAEEPLTVWYKTPATEWGSALPLGNGRMGALVFGDPVKDRIQLTEIAGYSNQGARYDARRGDLTVTFSTHARYKNYKRTLDLRTAQAVVEYVVDGITFKKEYHASMVDSVIIIRLTASKPESISCNLNLSAPFKSVKVGEGQAMIVMRGTTDGGATPIKPLRFFTLVKPLVKGGKSMLQNGTYAIRKANEVVIYAVMLSAGDGTPSGDYELLEAASRLLFRAYGKDYQTVTGKHVTRYQEFFNRQSVVLGTTSTANLPTDQRLKTATANDLSVQTLFYHVGRYLMISNAVCAKGSEMYRDLWQDQPTAAGQTGTNKLAIYWPLETVGLSELNRPIFTKTQSILDAKRAPGPSPVKPFGATSLANGLWDHYLFTGEKEFLLTHIPFMQAVARQYSDSLRRFPTSSRHDVKRLFLAVVNATETLHPGLKAFISPDKSLADSLKALINQVPILTNQPSTLPVTAPWRVPDLARNQNGYPSFALEKNVSTMVAMVELLLQSHKGAIFVLPALPVAWLDGSAKGLVARGGFDVALAWKSGRLTTATIHSSLGGNCRICSNVPLQAVGMKPSKGVNKNPFYEVEASNEDTAVAAPYQYDLPTVAGGNYTLISTPM